MTDCAVSGPNYAAAECRIALPATTPRSPAMRASEIAFQLDAFAQAANAQYQLFRNERVFADARRAIQERLETLRPAATAA